MICLHLPAIFFFLKCWQSIILICLNIKTDSFQVDILFNTLVIQSKTIKNSNAYLYFSLLKCTENVLNSDFCVPLQSKILDVQLFVDKFPLGGQIGFSSEWLEMEGNDFSLSAFSWPLAPPRGLKHMGSVV